MFQIVKDKENFLTLYRLYPELDDHAEYVDFSRLNRDIRTESEQPILEEDIELLKGNPWIELNMCTMHYYNYLYGEKNDIYNSMIFTESDISKLWIFVQKIFRKCTLIRTKTTNSHHSIIWNINVNGIREYGEKLLDLFDKKDEIPSMWKTLYLNNIIPKKEIMGLYIFQGIPQQQFNQSTDAMQKLLSNRFFRSMDISALSVEACEDIKEIKEIIDRSQMTGIVIEDHHFHCIKSIRWIM